MDTPRERALRLLYELLWAPGLDPGDLTSDVLARGRGRASGRVGALLSVGAISAEEAEEWRAHFAAGGRVPAVSDAGCREEASRVLGAFLDAVHEDLEGDDPRARERFSGALSALAEIGAIDRAAGNAVSSPLGLSLRAGWEAAEGESAEPYPEIGTDQDLIAVIAGPAELLEGWRVLYGLRFADDVVFACWSEAQANRHDDADLEDESGQDAWEFDLNDDVGTFYGGGDAWGYSGFQGVSFPTEGCEATPTSMVLISRSGHSIRLPM